MTIERALGSLWTMAPAGAIPEFMMCSNVKRREVVHWKGRRYVTNQSTLDRVRDMIRANPRN